MRALVSVVAVVLACTVARAEDPPPAAAPEVAWLPNGLALPYPTLRVFRAFGRCLGAGKRPARHEGKWRTHEHEGIDLGGLGPDGGLGSAVRAMTRARVVEIARGVDDPAKYGTPDLKDGDIDRDGTLYPRRFELAGYGLVHFFTRHRGYWRTGNMVVTVGVGGPLDGHEIRYMHLGAAHPDLKVGDEVQAGQELGVLGGTAVQTDAPHLHLDIRDADGEAVDPAPLLGLATSAWCGVPRARSLADRAAFKLAAAGRDWRADTWAPPVGRVGLGGPDARRLPVIDLLRTPPAVVAAGLVAERARFWHELALVKPCQPAVYEEDFASGAYAGHAWRMTAWRGQLLDVDVTFTARPDVRPTFAVSVDDRLVGDGVAVADPLAPVAATRVGERVRLEVRRTTDVLVSVLAPPAEAGEARPTDYRLTVLERCAGPTAIGTAPAP